MSNVGTCLIGAFLVCVAAPAVACEQPAKPNFPTTIASASQAESLSDQAQAYLASFGDYATCVFDAMNATDPEPSESELAELQAALEATQNEVKATIESWNVLYSGFISSQSD
ncbi:MAG: hypothetical protein AAFY15_00175 [Cyanobacteria bacterium J06648_11]